MKKVTHWWTPELVKQIHGSKNRSVPLCNIMFSFTFIWCWGFLSYIQGQHWCIQSFIAFYWIHIPRFISSSHHKNCPRWRKIVHMIYWKEYKELIHAKEIRWHLFIENSNTDCFDQLINAHALCNGKFLYRIPPHSHVHWKNLGRFV